MATRFGAARSSRSAQMKMKFAVGLLVVMIFVLFGSLIFLLSKMTDNEAGQTNNIPTDMMQSNQNNTQQAQVVQNVDVLISVTNISVGTEITSDLLTVIPMEQHKVAPGAILGRDKDQILKLYATDDIQPRQVILRSQLSDVRPISFLKLEPGYRAVTITVDSRSGVEGWAKPGTKVDVNWIFTQDGQKKVATILRQVEVLSFGGAKKAEGERVQVDKGMTVTLKVTENDSRKIELSRTMGELSLVLVGEEEPEVQREERPRVITIDEIVGSRPQPVQQTGQVTKKEPEEEIEGTMYATDSETGTQVKYVLIKGKRGWQRAADW